MFRLLLLIYCASLVESRSALAVPPPWEGVEKAIDVAKKDDSQLAHEREQSIWKSIYSPRDLPSWPNDKWPGDFLSRRSVGRYSHNSRSPARKAKGAGHVRPFLDLPSWPNDRWSPKRTEEHRRYDVRLRTRKAMKHASKEEMCNSDECHETASFIKKAMNVSANPCTDFYEYACGNWSANNPIPPYADKWNTLSILRDISESRVRDVLKTNIHSDDVLPLKLAKKLYASCMGTETIEKQGLKPLEAVLSKIGGWPITMDARKWNKNAVPWPAVSKYYARLIGLNPFVDYKILASREGEPAHIKLTELQLPLTEEFNVDFDRKSLYQGDEYENLIKETAVELIKEKGEHVSSVAVKKDVADVLNFEKKLYQVLKEEKLRNTNNNNKNDKLERDIKKSDVLDQQPAASNLKIVITTNDDDDGCGECEDSSAEHGGSSSFEDTDSDSNDSEDESDESDYLGYNDSDMDNSEDSGSEDSSAYTENSEDCDNDEESDEDSDEESNEDSDEESDEESDSDTDEDSDMNSDSDSDEDSEIESYEDSYYDSGDYNYYGSEYDSIYESKEMSNEDSEVVSDNDSDNEVDNESDSNESDEGDDEEDRKVKREDSDKMKNAKRHGHNVGEKQNTHRQNHVQRRKSLETAHMKKDLKRKTNKALKRNERLKKGSLHKQKMGVKRRQKRVVGKSKADYPLIWEKSVDAMLREAKVNLKKFKINYSLKPTYKKKLSALIKETPNRVIVNYIHWKFLSNAVQHTTDKLKSLRFKALQKLHGIKEELPRWKWCISKIKFADIASYEYARKHFSKTAQPVASHVVEKIQSVIEHEISDSMWLNDAHKKTSVNKLHNLKSLLEQPEWDRERSAIERFYKGLSFNEQFLGNMLTYKKYEYVSAMRAAERKMTDLDKWSSVNPILRNSRYVAPNNAFSATATDLHTPLTHAMQPAALNFALIGFITAHELSNSWNFAEGHRFRPESRDFKQNYLDKQECFVKQYEDYATRIGATNEAKGKAALNKNLADPVGIQAVYKAYKLWREGRKDEPVTKLPGLEKFNDEQLFFLSSASLWCEAEPSKTLKHGASRAKVFIELSNSEDFSAAFQCPVGVPMNPEEKCSIWK